MLRNTEQTHHRDIDVELTAAKSVEPFNFPQQILQISPPCAHVVKMSQAEFSTCSVVLCVSVLVTNKVSFQHSITGVDFYQVQQTVKFNVF